MLYATSVLHCMTVVYPMAMAKFGTPLIIAPGGAEPGSADGQGNQPDPGLGERLGNPVANSSWTLKIGLLCEYFCRLLRHIDQDLTVWPEEFRRVLERRMSKRG